MATSSKEPASKVTEQEKGVSPEGESADEVIASAPLPSNKGDTLVQIMYPNSSFVIEGLPVITEEGVKLTKDEAYAVSVSAIASGVRVLVNGSEITALMLKEEK